MRKISQARLRVVESDGSEREPRRYSQSTSGRIDSHGIAPPLSRSSEITSPSPSFCLMDNALRKYPIVVPQRSANEACSSTESELRNERSSSMNEQLPTGNVLSIPRGNLPVGNNDYPVAMEGDEKILLTRQRRLMTLVKEVGGFADLARLIDKGAGPQSFRDPSYINRAAKPGRHTKKITGDMARAIEKAAGKPPGWLDQAEDARPDWPFSFPKDWYYELESDEQKLINDALELQIQGIRFSPKLKKRKKASQ